MPRNKTKIIAEIIRIYCSLLSFHDSDDIFNENIGMLETRSSDDNIASADRHIIRISGGIVVKNDENVNPT